MRRIQVLLNARAGRLADDGPDQAVEALARLGTGGRTVDIRVLEPRAMVRAIEEAARSSHDTIVIGGGDGSANLAADALAGTGKALAVLPFGTMNLLARDLAMPADLDEAVSTLLAASPRRIDLGSVNGRTFHTLSGIGFFSQMARARQEERDGSTRASPFGRFVSLARAAWRAIRRTGRFQFEVTIDDRLEVVDAFAVLVTVNHFGADWRRPRLDQGLLELHIAEDTGALAMMRAGADLLTGAWRDNPGIRNLTATSVKIAHRRRRAWTATDGELVRARLPLRFEVRPRALTVLTAAPIADVMPDAATATAGRPVAVG